MKFCCGVILYNPELDVSIRLNRYSQMFEKVYVYDNSLSRNDELLKGLDNVTYDFNGKNDGMSIALNWLFSNSIEDGFDYILTMDQDTEYPDIEIFKMIKYIRQSDDRKIAIFSPNYAKLYKDGKNKAAGKLKIQRNSVREVIFSMTSGSFMNVKYLPYVIPLDNWFIGLVDYDVCALVKVHNPNAKIIRYGNSVMYQEVGELVALTWFNELFHIVHLSDIRYYYMIRNAMYFLRKYQNVNNQFARIAKKQIIRIIINVLFEKNKIKKMQYIYRGYNDYKEQVIGEYVKNRF